MRQWLTVFLLGYGASACGGDSGMCGEIYDKFIKCEKEEMEKEGDEDDMDKIPSRKEFVASCEAAEGERKAHWKELSRCTKEPDCESLKACEREVSASLRIKEQLEDIDKAMKKEDWKKAFEECMYSSDEIKENEKLAAACEEVFATAMPKLMADKATAEDVQSHCNYSGDDLKKASPAYKKTCDEAALAVIETKKKEALALRDRGEDDFSTCSELKRQAESVGGDVQKQAEALCAEVSAAPNIKQALDAAKAEIAARSGNVPYSCTYAIDSLNTMTPQTEWAKARKDEVLRNCWIENGKILLETKLPEMDTSKSCDYSVQVFRQDLGKYQLTGIDPAFDDLLVKSDAYCGPR